MFHKNTHIDSYPDLGLRSPEAEFKEFEPRLKFWWFHLNLYLFFQDLSRRLIETGFWGI